MSIVQHSGSLEEKFEEVRGSLGGQSLNSNFSVQFLEVTFLIVWGNPETSTFLGWQIPAFNRTL